MTSDSSFTFVLEVPRKVQWIREEGLRSFEREDFFAFLWEHFGAGCDLFADGEGLVGIHEGTLLSKEAFESGVESDAWMVDSGEAPRDRDWIDSQESESAVIYFGKTMAAARAREIIIECSGLVCGEILEQKAEDWDAAWKASFQGVVVPPCWEILPPWRETAERSDSKIIRLNPGAGFGTGTHETTQLCLQAVAFAIPDLLRHGFRGEDEGKRLQVLDFGSGSGILSIGAAVLGADVDGIEIDPMAIDNANENLAMNLIEGQVRFVRTMEELGTPDKKYPVVIANILRPVLLEFASLLVGKIERPGRIVLSGLIATDLPEVIARYSGLLGTPPQIFERGEWRALVFEAK